MGTRVDAGSVLTPWRERERAIRVLGRVRRAIADAAMEGTLPDVELRERYRSAERDFLAAHEAWLASR